MSKLCSVYDRKKDEQVCNQYGPIKFPVFMFKFFSTCPEGWQMNLICFLNGLTQDFGWQSYRGIISWGKWCEEFIVEITPGSTPIQIWPMPPGDIRDWLIRQGRQLINEIKADVHTVLSWLRGGR